MILKKPTIILNENQFGFLANRNILNGPLILNETLAWINKVKKTSLCFKKLILKKPTIQLIGVY